MNATHQFFAAAPRGIAAMLGDEITALGAESVGVRPAGVSFGGPLELGYRVCLWSRLASRVLLVLDDLPAKTADVLYDSARTIDWSQHLKPTGTLAVQFNGTSPALRHTHFSALRVKDAVVDQFRDTYDVRPSVDVERPDLRIDAHLHGTRVTLSLDLTGPLPRRGYRMQPVDAPLRENLAAAVLIRGGWPQIAAEGGALVDLMCGSGTLLIEAAWMAADRAPALGRNDLSLTRWAGHDAAVWDRLRGEARQRYRDGLSRMPTIVGYDTDPVAVRATRINARAADLVDHIRVERHTLNAGAHAIEPDGPGLVVANPPYGERLSDQSGVRALFTEMGGQLRTRFAGWRAAIITTNGEWAQPLGLSSGPEDIVYNGALECHLLHGEITARPPRVTSAPSTTPTAASSDGAQMLANRLRKNLKTIGKWARREGVTCYRVYDADMPEYSLAVDVYTAAESERRWAHVQEYRAPASVDPARAAARLQEALPTISEVLEIDGADLHFKVREKKKGTTQYERLGRDGDFHAVREGPVTLFVNFTDYLDTGLFLDHRPTRLMIGEQAKGKRFLNLFGYTGSATVHAAAGGAASTTTVDMSKTYIEWARRNLHGNGFRGVPHALVQADCLLWLEQHKDRRFDLIFLDPPTFSNSKRMDEPFDVAADHVALIERTGRLLDAGGELLFSTNARRFTLDEAALASWECKDITRATIPRDFERNAKIHQCWRIRRR